MAFNFPNGMPPFIASPSNAMNEPELPQCQVENLEQILFLFKTTHPMIRSKILQDLIANDGAYIVKLLDLFDLCELEDDRTILHRIFKIFYALVELCDRRLIEILLKDENFFTLLGVFGYNPSLIREMDFRTGLEEKMQFKEIIPIEEKTIKDRVHMNYRIHVIKDNVLSRSLPDCSVIMLEHIINENNYHILSYLAETPEYWQQLKQKIKDKGTCYDGLKLLKEIIQLVRITRPLDRHSQPRREALGAGPGAGAGAGGPSAIFGTLINGLFHDGNVFENFSVILGTPESKMEEIALVLEILNLLILYQGPERIRMHLSIEGKCISPPKSDEERIIWKPGASFFTSLVYAFEKYEPTRMQMFSLLKEVFRVPLGNDDKFLSVLYPNYIHWILQPLKYTSMDLMGDDLFALQDRIMELLTFCTEMHGYRVKYLFGRQPIASYVKKMLFSKNKQFIIHAVKFVRACVGRAEAFFSRFLIQNDLFTPIMAQLQLGGKNTCAISSAILELLSFIEKAKLTALIEHVYTKFYAIYKSECPIVFEAIRKRYEELFGTTGPCESPPKNISNTSMNGGLFVRTTRRFVVEDDEMMDWEKDNDDTETNGLSENDVPFAFRSCEPNFKKPKLVDYDDEEDNPIATLDESDLMLENSPKSDLIPLNDSVEEFKLPIRKKEEEDENMSSFLGGTSLNKRSTGTSSAQLRRRNSKSPKYKNMFQKISWKGQSSNSNITGDGIGSASKNQVADDSKGETRRDAETIETHQHPQPQDFNDNAVMITTTKTTSDLTSSESNFTPAVGSN